MASPQPDRSSARRYTLLAVKIAVSIILLTILFSKIDRDQLWRGVRGASFAWLAAALALFSINVLASTWRWHLLLRAQSVFIERRRLLASFLVANFFNNFLPSNVGGDVIRITDSAKYTRSKTLATVVVLMDRGLGVMALVLVAAIAATAAGAIHPAATPIWPMWLWVSFFAGAALSAPAVLAPDGFGRLLQPLTVIHPEWVGGRIENLTAVLARFRDRPRALAGCFIGALFVQLTMVVFYFLVAWALHLNVALSDLGVIVPISFVVQLLPVSVNGFGVREATFSLYFQRIGQPIAAALLVSLVGQALIMLFSVTGAAVYVSRTHHAHS
ncbi:MAG TPA: lysylphosphatidylglycerol synthase transmembrane domain-containing protein [Vicinamibacterales bacterium]